MRKIRTFGVAAVIAAAAAVPLAGGTFAGAQDAGDCGSGGAAVAGSTTNIGGLVGSLVPALTQAFAPVNAPVTSPNQCTSNSNSNSIGGGGGGHGVAPAHAAGAVGGAPRFAG
jgi:hypothetical protein